MANPQVELKPIIEHALGVAGNEILAGKEALRMFFAANAAGEVNVICAPRESDEAEDMLLGLLRMVFAVRRITGESGQPLELKSYATRTITRNPTAVGPLHWPEFDVMDGRMTTLLPPADLPSVPHEVRDKVMELIQHPMFEHRTSKLH